MTIIENGVVDGAEEFNSEEISSLLHNRALLLRLEPHENGTRVNFFSLRTESDEEAFVSELTYNDIPLSARSIDQIYDRLRRDLGIVEDSERMQRLRGLINNDYERVRRASTSQSSPEIRMPLLSDARPIRSRPVAERATRVGEVEDHTSQALVIAAEQMAGLKVDAAQAVAPIHYLHALKSAYEIIHGPLPADQDKAAGALAKFHKEASDRWLDGGRTAVEMQRLNAQEAELAATERIFTNLGRASGNALAILAANPEVRRMIAPVIHAAALALQERALVGVDIDTATANQLAIAESRARARTAKQMARAEADTHAQRLRDGVNAERDRLGLEIAGERAEQRAEALGVFGDAIGSQTRKSLHGVKNLILGPQDGVLVSVVEAAGGMVKKTFESVKQVMPEIATATIGGATGYVGFAYLLSEATSIASVVNQSVFLALGSGLGAIIGVGIPVGIVEIGKRRNRPHN